MRIDYSGATPRVIDGPFSETKELVAGFWILQARSQDEAIEWLKRAPLGGGQVEVRAIAEADDLGEAFTPELRDAEDRRRRQIEEQRG